MKRRVRPVRGDAVLRGIVGTLLFGAPLRTPGTPLAPLAPQLDERPLARGGTGRQGLGDSARPWTAGST